jgi:hypothetical protein
MELRIVLLLLRLYGRGVEDFESVPMLFDGDPDCVWFDDERLFLGEGDGDCVGVFTVEGGAEGGGGGRGSLMAAGRRGAVAVSKEKHGREKRERGETNGGRRFGRGVISRIYVSF